MKISIIFLMLIVSGYAQNITQPPSPPVVQPPTNNTVPTPSPPVVQPPTNNTVPPTVPPTNDTIIPPVAPVPPVIVTPILYDQLWPKTTVTVGFSSSADIKVDATVYNSFYNGTQEVLDYFVFIETFKQVVDPKKLLIEAGTYDTTTQIYILSNNTEFAGVSSKDTIIQLADNTPSWLNANSSRSPGLLRTKFVDNLYLHDFSVDGNQANQALGGLSSLSKSGIYIHACTNVMITNIRVGDFQESGLIIHEDTIVNVQSSNVQITNSQFDSNYQNGIELYGVVSSSMTNNLISSNIGGIGLKGGGILITQGSQDIKVQTNNFTDNNYGIITNLHLAKQVGFVTIENNNIENSTLAGIYSSNSTNVYFTNNLINISRSCWKLNTIENSIFANNTCKDILLWSGKRNTTGFDKCVDCLNTTIETNALTSGAPSLKVSMTMLIMSIGAYMMLYLL
jgi:hypothetical protein